MGARCSMTAKFSTFGSPRWREHGSGHGMHVGKSKVGVWGLTGGGGEETLAGQWQGEAVMG